VHSFLGDVNIFHGRLVRPHEVVLSRTSPGAGAIPVTVRHVRTYGAIVRLELDPVDGEQSIAAEVTRDWFAEVALRAGDRAYVTMP
jgi:ABC-type sulfate/molybdate transport systems ATPase subunit